MAEKPNQEANSQSSKLDESELQKLEEESRRQTECNVCFRWVKPARSVHVFMQAKLPVGYFQSFLTLLNGHFFASMNSVISFWRELVLSNFAVIICQVLGAFKSDFQS